MKIGDAVLYYHSGEERAIVGMAKITRAAFPDPTRKTDEEKGQWVAVELEAGKALKNPVPLAAVKGEPALKNLLLVRHSRLSVMPVNPEEYEHILRLAR